MAVLVKPPAVVVDLQDGGSVAPAKGHPAGRSLRVPADVRQGLAGDLDEVRRAGRELRGDLRIDVDDGDDSGSRLEILGEIAQGLVELPVRQDARSKTEDVVAQVANHAVDLVHRG